ncbi:hypothetical protein KUTeg_020872 [Tegillarca granosa]|uniref:Amidase domain-containing protein n=1 Tax=Tegillarca granosa TaxID=220873 RepID=A0ABQ9EEG2_TEGGR|nr:hypothetical protein KUTeg_020872 [Tegillarca granosa]
MQMKKKRKRMRTEDNGEANQNKNVEKKEYKDEKEKQNTSEQVQQNTDIEKKEYKDDKSKNYDEKERQIKDAEVKPIGNVEERQNADIERKQNTEDTHNKDTVEKHNKDEDVKKGCRKKEEKDVEEKQNKYGNGKENRKKVKTVREKQNDNGKGKQIKDEEVKDNENVEEMQNADVEEKKIEDIEEKQNKDEEVKQNTDLEQKEDKKKGKPVEMKQNDDEKEKEKEIKKEEVKQNENEEQRKNADVERMQNTDEGEKKFEDIEETQNKYGSRPSLISALNPSKKSMAVSDKTDTRVIQVSGGFTTPAFGTGKHFKRFRILTTREELLIFQEEYKGTLKEYQRVNELLEQRLPVKYPRCPGIVWTKAKYAVLDKQGAPSGKLAGKTVGIKDNIAVSGVPMMNGSKLLEGYTPEFDATVVTRILDEGGRILGKTVCEDLCLSGSSWTSSTGPLTKGRQQEVPVQELAQNKVDLALGGDQGGSIRIQACCCGVVGLKPTHGLVPYAGIIPFEMTLPRRTNGQNSNRLCIVIAGQDEKRDPRQPTNLEIPEYTKFIENSIEGKKIGLLKEGFTGSEEDVANQVRAAANRLKEAGAIVKEISVPIHNDGNGNNWKGHYPLSLQEALARRYNLRPQDFPITVKLVSVFAEYMKRNYQNKFYAKCQNLGSMLTQAFDEASQEYDVLVMPTLPQKSMDLPTTKHGLLDKFKLSFDMMKNNASFNVTGHPALTINTGFLDGFPIGMMVVGRMFDEVTVLQVSRNYEILRDGK